VQSRIDSILLCAERLKLVWQSRNPNITQVHREESHDKGKFCPRWMNLLGEHFIIWSRFSLKMSTRKLRLLSRRICGQRTACPPWASNRIPLNIKWQANGWQQGEYSVSS
jgi:hypothetical protein